MNARRSKFDKEVEVKVAASLDAFVKSGDSLAEVRHAANNWAKFQAERTKTIREISEMKTELKRMEQSLLPTKGSNP